MLGLAAATGRMPHHPPDPHAAADPARVRLLVVGPHPIARAGVRAIVAAACPGVEVVGEAADARQVGGVGFDVAVVDAPPADVPAAVAALLAGPPPRAVVVLSACDHPDAVRRAFAAGASGYVLQRSAADELARAVRAAAAGEAHLDPAAAGADPGGLSEREEAAVRRIALGYSNKEIAARLGVSTKAVETYKARAMGKLGLDSRVELVKYAALRGWFADLGPPRRKAAGDTPPG